MAIEALEGLTDEQLFSEANADEAPAEKVEAEAPEPAEQPGPARDEAGRFAKADPEPETVAATDPPAKTPVDDNAAQVPSWRVREINEEKRAALTELEALRGEFSRAQLQLRQQQPKPVETVKVEKPDPLLDPDGYEKYLEQKFEAKRREDRQDTDMELTRQSNTEAFDKAHNEAMRLKNSGSPEFLELSQKMKDSLQPGKVLLKWHQDRTVRAEVGDDPNAYFDKRLEAFLTDPANQAKVLERIRGGVQPAANGKAPPVNLPPSLTRVASAAANSADDDDISDDGLWRHANA